MNKLLNILLLAFLMPAIACAQATIKAPDSRTLIMPNVKATTTAAVGSTLANVEVIGILSRTGNINCTFDQVGQMVGANLVSGYSNVYQTNIPGVGLKAGVTEGWNGALIWAPFNKLNNSVFGVAQKHYIRMELVAISRTVSAGVLVNPPYFEVTYSGSCFPTGKTRIDLVSERIAPTCAVSTKNFAVTLPRVKLTQLETAASTAGDTNFSIGLNCPADAIAYLTFTDKNNAANRGNYLTLDKSSTASGVGIEILHGANPVSYRDSSLPPGSEGQIKLVGATTSVPLKARYRSLGKPSVGTVRSVAVITFSYH